LHIARFATFPQRTTGPLHGNLCLETPRVPAI